MARAHTAALVLTAALAACTPAAGVPAPVAPPTATPSLVAPPPATATVTSRATPTAVPTIGTAAPSLTPPATPTPTVAPLPIGALGAGRVGEQVTVEGVVVATASFSAGFKLTLDDGTGRVVLLLWHEVYDDCWDAGALNLGARVRATGRVEEYEGELQVQPRYGGDVKALEAATAWPAPREIGALGPADAGQRVTVEGEVVRVEGLASAVKVFVRDASGETLVFVWRNVLDRVAANAGLGTVGSRVRVAGTVQVYRNNLELVPALPVDVLVLEVP